MDFQSRLAVAALCTASAHAKESADNAEMKRLQLRANAAEQKIGFLEFRVDSLKDKVYLMNEILEDNGLLVEFIMVDQGGEMSFGAMVSKQKARNPTTRRVGDFPQSVRVVQRLPRESGGVRVQNA